MSERSRERARGLSTVAYPEVPIRNATPCPTELDGTALPVVDRGGPRPIGGSVTVSGPLTPGSGGSGTVRAASGRSVRVPRVIPPPVALGGGEGSGG